MDSDDPVVEIAHVEEATPASGMAIADPTEPVAIPVVYLAVAPTASSRSSSIPYSSISSSSSSSIPRSRKKLP